MPNRRRDSHSITLKENNISDRPDHSKHSHHQQNHVRIILVVEGENDIKFLRRISTILHAANASVPSLAEWEQRGELILIPFGGGGVAAWERRLEPLRIPEFHIYDHELLPETDVRKTVAELVNSRHQCRAILTQKRSLENHLHPQAIQAAMGVEVTVEDFVSVGELVAKRLSQQESNDTPWELLPHRTRKRLSNRAKNKLNTDAVELMTTDLLQERDPDGELLSWLHAIADLANSAT